MTTTEMTPEVTFIEHLGQEIQVQLVRGETAADKAVIWLQNLAGGAGRRIEADSAEAKALMSKFAGVADLVQGVAGAVETVDPAAAPAISAAETEAQKVESEFGTKLDQLLELLTSQQAAPAAAPEGAPAPPPLAVVPAATPAPNTPG